MRSRPAPARRVEPAFPPLHAFPGHLIRRLQQVAVSLFLEEAADAGCELTPVQYAALLAVREHPHIDQVSLAGVIAHDSTTIVGVLDRLERKGLLRRRLSPQDRRVRQLVIEPAGVVVLDRMLPAVVAAQLRILEPLAGKDQAVFMRLLAKLVSGNNGNSRAPMRPVRARPAPAAVELRGPPRPMTPVLQSARSNVVDDQQATGGGAMSSLEVGRSLRAPGQRAGRG